MSIPALIVVAVVITLQEAILGYIAHLIWPEKKTK